MKKISQTEIQNLMTLHQRGLDDDLINKATSLVKEYPEEIILFNLLGISFERKGWLYQLSIQEPCRLHTRG